MKVLTLFLISVLLLGCVTITPQDYKTEETCSNAELNWCDDNADGNYTCQTAECHGIGALTDELKTDTSIDEGDTNLGNLDTSTKNVGLGSLGDIGGTLNPLGDVDTSGGVGG